MKSTTITATLILGVIDQGAPKRSRNNSIFTILYKPKPIGRLRRVDHSDFARKSVVGEGREM